MLPEYDTLESTEADLASMMTRLREILDAPLGDRAFVELCAIHNNVAYVFLYLESNEAHIAYERLMPWKERFFDHDALNLLMLERVQEFHTADPEIARARATYLKHFEAKQSRPVAETESEERVLRSAREVQGRIDEAQRDFVTRLGIEGRTSSPGVGFYKLQSRTDRAETRERLGEAWRRIINAHSGDLVAAVNAVVDERRVRAVARGYRTVLDETIERCGVSKADAWELLRAYMVGALEEQEALEAQIRHAVDVPKAPMDHFAYFVRGLQGNAAIPEFDLEGCLRAIVEVCERAFQLAVNDVSEPGAPVRRLAVERSGEPVGTVTLDLWDTGARTSNQTRGIRNRVDYSGIVQLPAAYVSCRFRRLRDRRARITFQNAHSLFHEFGHAVNHLLIERRLPTESGLEYLPLERIEVLSMWFEKWVFSDLFAEHVCDSPLDYDGLRLCWEIKKLEYRRSHVERAVSAALDYRVHAEPREAVESAFASLDSEFGISPYCGVGDFPGYFLWPMYRANPGAHFAYIWGAAKSAQLFDAFWAAGNQRVNADATNGLFAPYFDNEASSEAPMIDALFDFYRSSDPTEVLRP